MGRHGRNGWVSGFLCAAFFMAALCAVWISACHAGPSPVKDQLSKLDEIPASENDYLVPPPQKSHWGPSFDELLSCPKSPASVDHFVLVVSTIDGSISALNMRTSGDLLWSVKPDERPLLSSSITNIQVTRDGVSTRIIPSLDGGLYEFDGEDIKALPMTADSLLSSSLRITDNSVMVGGKEVGSYGIDVRSGELSYRCTSAGCKDTMEAANNGGDMLVITRNMQTVRAVDVNSGTEKWNFSVGQHELLFVRSQKQRPEIEHDNDSMMDATDDDVSIDACLPIDEDELLLEEAQQKQLIKVVVSEGLIVGLSPDDPTQMSWSRKFSSPVTKAWILHRGKLEEISLFDSKVVPTLSSQHASQHHRNTQGDPLLYVGTHKRQLYVQKEEADSCEKELPWMMRRQHTDERSAITQLPRVTWRPYLSKAESHTPLFLGNEQPQVPLLSQRSSHEDLTEDTQQASSLTVWHENYPFDMGYYLYPSRMIGEPLQLNLEDPVEEGIIYVLPASLWMWWKEVLAISLLVSLAVHLLLTYLIYRPARIVVQVDSSSLEKKDSSASLVSSDSYPTMSEERPFTQEFKSRFADEFECIEQLGKGGYGIVFRARNKVDEQEYAVKRIALPNRDGAVKKKMLREVRTLAMLDHVGIVRYFHSWIEDPPPGWQEDRDRAFSQAMGLSEGLSPNSDFTLPSSAEPYSISPSPQTPTPPPTRKSTAAGRQPSSVLADIMPFRPDNWDTHWQSLPGATTTGSGEFSMHSHQEPSSDESGSFSLGAVEEFGVRGEDLGVSGEELSEGEEKESIDLLSTVFHKTEAECSYQAPPGVDPVLPFTRYTSGKNTCMNASLHKDAHSEEKSSSVVFEDSRSKKHRDCSLPPCILSEDSDSRGNKGHCQSSSLAFEDSLRKENKENSHSASIISEDSYSRRNKDTSESSSIVFEDSCSRRKKDTSESSSIVFEDSHSSKDHKSSSGHHKQFRSAVLSDSSYGGSVDDNESGDNCKRENQLKGGNHEIDITVPNHRGEGERCRKEEEEEEKRLVKGVKGEEKGGEKKTRLYLYLQMQLCQLQTLKDWLISNTLNRERTEILDIFEQIVSAVDYVHAKGLIHRDMKPSNIFFALDNTVKVGDFGLVTAPENQGDDCDQLAGNKASAKHTAEVGTQLYMSPEQIQKKPYDQKVDIFSLGLILLELLIPFSTGMERVTTLQNARKGIFPQRFIRELPVESDLVKQLMSSRPENRPTALQILEHSLLRDINPHLRRVCSGRFRTISNSSNHSDSHFSSL